jgi:hypothetical protein
MRVLSACLLCAARKYASGTLLSAVQCFRSGSSYPFLFLVVIGSSMGGVPRPFCPVSNY